MNMFKINKNCIALVDYGVTVVREVTLASNKNYGEWLDRGLDYPLTYMKDRERRLEFKAKSALVFLFSYAEFMQDLLAYYNSSLVKNRLRFAAFSLAYEGFDYHHIIKNFLLEVLADLQQQGYHGVVAVDSSPILERDLAYRALPGRVWFGKNSMLLHKEHGSLTIIGEILLDQEYPLPPTQDVLTSDCCGKCQCCFESCPTSAINKDKKLITTAKCLSALSVEVRKATALTAKLDGTTFFGCDRCLLACPWNQRALAKHTPKPLESYFHHPKFKLLYDFFFARDEAAIFKDLSRMSNNGFRKMFAGTSLERTGREGILKNLQV
ncbi:MAG: hypothetical protein HQK50_10405 [Oligoflexia bacterium]|nr:hypothetical protein [Oligoflexia bacterium]